MSQILSGFLGWTLVDPILKFITPTKARICVIPYPITHDDKYWVGVNVLNDGIKEITSLEVEYKFTGTELKRGRPDKVILKKDDRAYFEIEADLNPNCEYATWKEERYRDKSGQCYAKAIVTSKENVCGFKWLELNAYSGNKLVEQFRYNYPYFETGVEIDLPDISLFYECIDYDNAPDKSELVRVQDVYWNSTDISILCLRGDRDKLWCQKRGYAKESCSH